MTLLGTLVFGYGFLVAIMFVAQRNLIYRPTTALEPPSEAVQTVQTRTADGLELTHWFRPSADDDALTIVVFHGNAGNLSHRLSKYHGFSSRGHGLLLAGYRGFGGNPGKPSEEGLLQDARSVLAWLAEQGIPPERLVLYGESLGTGVAVKLATEKAVAGVLLEAPYSSVAEVAQHHYWYLPAKWLILDRWDSLDRIAEIGAPLLVLHGEADRVIPVKFGKRLFAAAVDPKDLTLEPQAGHNDLLAFPGVVAQIDRFLGRLASP